MSLLERQLAASVDAEARKKAELQRARNSVIEAAKLFVGPCYPDERARREQLLRLAVNTLALKEGQ